MLQGTTMTINVLEKLVRHKHNYVKSKELCSDRTSDELMNPRGEKMKERGNEGVLQWRYFSLSSSCFVIG